MKKKEYYSEYGIKFWKEWLDADALKRLELVKKLPLFKMCLGMKDTKIWRFAFANFINNYFEDLENEVYIKISHNKQVKKKSGFGTMKGIGKYSHEKISDFD